MKIKNYAWLLAIALIACESDDDGNEPFDGTDETKSYIVVGNQGGFLASNASITLYDIEDEVATQGVYASANDDAALGDVLQSMYHRDDEVYVVVNNSSKVEVLDDETFEQERTIEGLGSPRFMHFLSDDKAYVTEFTFGSTTHNIHIVNPSNGTYIGAISTDYFVENMAAYDGKVWVTSPDAGKVVLVNPDTDTVEDEITVGPNATDIVVDANGKVWVLCQGIWGTEAPSLYKIDGATKTVDTIFNFPAETPYGGFMHDTSAGTELLMLIGDKLYEMGVDATELPTEALITRAGENLFGFSVNPSNGDIVVTDAVDFSSAGYVYLYDADGNLKADFEGGVAPWAAFWD